MSSPRDITHAMATCATLAPRASATARSVSTSERLRSRFSPVKRGRWARKSWALAVLAPVSGDEAPGEHAVCRDADAELARRLQDLVLDPPRNQRVLGLDITDGVHGVRPAERVRADLGETDVADVPGLHHLGEDTDGLLDRQRVVDPSRSVDVDVVRAQSAQAVGEEVPDRRRPGVDAAPAPVRSAQGAELHAENDVLAPAATEGVAKEQLVVAHAIEVTRVEESDSRVEGRVNRGNALLIVGRAVEV